MTKPTATQLDALRRHAIKRGHKPAGYIRGYLAACARRGFVMPDTTNQGNNQ